MCLYSFHLFNVNSIGDPYELDNCCFVFQRTEMWTRHAMHMALFYLFGRISSAVWNEDQSWTYYDNH